MFVAPDVMADEIETYQLTVSDGKGSASDTVDIVVKAKPVVRDSGEIAARQLMGVTLACAIRILYGADGAEFLARVRQLLEEPLGLAL